MLNKGYTNIDWGKKLLKIDFSKHWGTMTACIMNDFNPTNSKKKLIYLFLYKNQKVY